MTLRVVPQGLDTSCTGIGALITPWAGSSYLAATG